MDDSCMLNGYWLQTYVNEDGVEQPAQPGSFAIIAEMRDGEFTVRTSNGQLVLKGYYVVDENVHPPHIDWTDIIGEEAGKTFLSVYKLTPTSFDFCAADEGMPRPTSVLPATGHTVRRFTRLDSMDVVSSWD